MEHSARYYMVREGVRILFWSGMVIVILAAVFLTLDALLHFLLPSQWQGGRDF